jgi:phage shock protein A
MAYDYSSIAGKIRLAGLGIAHSVLDKVIDLNSVAAVEQQIRDLQSERKSVAKGEDDAIANIRIANRDKSPLDAQMHDIETTMIFIRDDANHDDAYKATALAPYMKRKINIDAQLKSVASTIQVNAANKLSLHEALMAIDQQIDDMTARVERLKASEASARAKESAASALQSASEILGRNNHAGLDSALQRAEKRDARADVGLERAMDDVHRAADAAGHNVEVDAAVAAYLKTGKQPVAEAAAS